MLCYVPVRPNWFLNGSETVTFRLGKTYAEIQALMSRPMTVVSRFLTLSENGWTGVATGKSHRGLVDTLGQHNLLERFTTLQTADRAPGKPNPEMLFKAMEETGASPEVTVMIGDTSYDMEMAVNAGVLGIGAAWGYHETQELRGRGRAQ